MELAAEVAAGAPDPADALRRLARVVEAAEAAGLALDRGPEARTILALACQRAPYLATLLARDPARLGRVLADRYLRREKPRAVMAAELADRLAGDPDDRELARQLRRYRGDEMVRLGARELGLGSATEVGAELGHLADVSLDAAIEHHRRALEARFGPARYLGDDGAPREAELCVIGMGKLGGEELNFASDVDLIYVYSSDAGEVGPLSLHEFFARLCERVTAALSEVTDDDTVFRVDLRLRPEGSKGAIANSLPSLERYYEAWGRPWERQAWIKARPCAGSPALGAEVMRTLAPFVWPRHTSPSVIADVADLNRRIKSELAGGRIERGFDLKNGLGGIREVEFFAQALQLIHGGQRPALRARGTVAALDQLLFAGLISEAEWSRLGGAYRAMRRLEHLLQLDTGRQTQRLPGEPAALELFARRAGHPDAAGLMAALARHTAEVARLFATLGDADPGPPAEAVALLRGERDAIGELAALSALGFRDPPQARHNLERARRRAASPFGHAAAGAAARVGPVLVAEIGSSPDPDQALRYAAELAGRYAGWDSLWRMMDDDRAMLRLVASLFGTSEYLSKQFLDHPELFDTLRRAGQAGPGDDREALAGLLAGRGAELGAVDDEAWWDALAEWKNAQVLRIGLADIAGERDAEAVCGALSALAEVVLGAAFARVAAGLDERHGVPRDEQGAPVAMAVLALGKLGGRELGYASDLDLVFVYRADGESDGARPLANVSYMTRLAQRLMGALHALHPGGRLYEIDTRLRPSGSKGLLVSSLAAWRRYHREALRGWERQALTRLRPVAGDPAVGAAALESAHACIYDPAAALDRAALAAGVNEMRERIERELPGERGRDLKAGRGGLIDVEFAGQFLQLAHGAALPALRTTSTLGALRAAAAALPACAGACALLCDGYRFLRTLEHRMRIVHDRSVQRLPDDPIELDKLARRVGLERGPELAATYDRWTREVRAAYIALLGLAA